VSPEIGRVVDRMDNLSAGRGGKADAVQRAKGNNPERDMVSERETLAVSTKLQQIAAHLRLIGCFNDNDC